MHVPKTAGTSLRLLLAEKVYAGRLREIYLDYGYWNVPALRAQVGRGDVLYGHFSYGFHALLGDPAPRYVTVLRHPVERVVSLYWHHHRLPQAPLHAAIHAEGLDIAGFVERQLTEESNNHMVRMLAARYSRGRRWREIAGNRLHRALTGRPVRPLRTRLQLYRALRNLKRSFAFVGRTEDLDGLLDFIAHDSGLERSCLTLGHENVQRPGGFVLRDRDRRAIENANELDLDLYQRLFG